MAVTQVGTATTAVTTNTGTVTVNKPTDVVEGDFLIATFAVNEGTITASGWTAFVTRTDTPNNTFGGYLYYKWAGPSEPSTYTFSSSATDAPMPIVVTAWRGVHTTDPMPAGAVEVGGNVSANVNPNPPNSFSQGNFGLLFYSRLSRAQVSPTPTFTNSSASWSLLGQIGGFSGGQARYSVCQVWHNTRTGAGTRSEPDVRADVDTTDNVYILGYLREEPDRTGAITSQLPSVTSTFAGEREMPAGSITAQLPKITSSFTATGAPPEGALAAALPKVSASFQASGVGGGFTSTLPSIHSEWEGGVEPIGPFELTLPSLTSSFVAETSVFGEHVIRVEREDRAFRVVDDGITSTGLKPIKRSKVSEQ